MATSRRRSKLSGNSTSQPPHGSIQIRCVTSILLNRRSAVIGWNLVSLGTLTGSLVHRLQRRPRSPTLFSFIWGRFLSLLETPTNEVYPVSKIRNRPTETKYRDFPDWEPTSNQDSSHERGP